jgi:hypothetical protein
MTVPLGAALFDSWCGHWAVGRVDVIADPEHFPELDRRVLRD